MIKTHDNSGTLVPVVYNGYTLNSITGVETAVTGSLIKAVAHSSAIDYLSENKQWTDGMEVYNITKVSRVIQITGILHAASKAALGDLEKALCHAFDPGDIAFNNDDPFLPMTFSTVQATPVASKYLVLPLRMPEPLAASSQQGFSSKFMIPFLAKDPRRYAQTAVTEADGGTLENPDADYRSYPSITFTMTGAGHASFTAQNVATRQGTKALVLDLSGRSNTQAITVDFDNRRVLVNGTATQAIFKSGDWWEVEPGNNVLTFTNTGNVGTITTTAYPAFSY